VNLHFKFFKEHKIALESPKLAVKTLRPIIKHATVVDPEKLQSKSDFISILLVYLNDWTKI